MNLGRLCGLPSLVLLVVARIELGGAFSVRPKAQRLVTNGLYSRISNPIYLFGSLTIVAFFLYIRQPLDISVLVVIIPLQIYRYTTGREDIGRQIWRGIPPV